MRGTAPSTECLLRHGDPRSALLDPDALARVSPDLLTQCLLPVIAPGTKYTVVARGLPAGPGPYQAERQAAGQRAPQPTLYLHGSADGCIGVVLVRDAERHLGPGSRLRVIQDAGHFPQVEQPGEVSRHILAWVTS